MRLTYEEIKGYGINVKRWLGLLQTDGRNREEPFTVQGPSSCEVKTRSKGTAGPQRVNWSFIGGERFALSSVHYDQDPLIGDARIKVGFTPLSMDVAKSISSMEMPLDEAMNFFDGLEGFVSDRLQLSSTGMSVKEVLASPEEKSRTEREECPGWGSW